MNLWWLMPFVMSRRSGRSMVTPQSVVDRSGPVCGHPAGQQAAVCKHNPFSKVGGWTQGRPGAIMMSASPGRQRAIIADDVPRRGVLPSGRR